MKFVAVIPARYASTRFPGKPLCMLEGKTMIERVYEQVCKNPHFAHVLVATDDSRIFDAVQAFGGQVLMTSSEHRSGTDRVADAVRQWKDIAQDDVVVNIQGDEPFIDPLQLDELMACFDKEQVQIATLAKPIQSQEILKDPNIVKVVQSNEGKALYFSRLPIPYLRNKSFADHIFYQHIGVYAYRMKTLQEIVQLPTSLLEQAESLEQLRWIENGCAIYLQITHRETFFGIDTPEDMQKAIEYIRLTNK